MGKERAYSAKPSIKSRDRCQASLLGLDRLISMGAASHRPHAPSHGLNITSHRAKSRTSTNHLGVFTCAALWMTRAGPKDWLPPGLLENLFKMKSSCFESQNRSIKYYRRKHDRRKLETLLYKLKQAPLFLLNSLSIPFIANGLPFSILSSPA